ncbi:hypothetical protein GCM10025857_38940 [Alicyclobacillus contaminans]|nr:hypothetical protein GCM10025857_38940 [Alicyclobacillus contaminans]
MESDAPLDRAFVTGDNAVDKSGTSLCPELFDDSDAAPMVPPVAPPRMDCRDDWRDESGPFAATLCVTC